MRAREREHNANDQDARLKRVAFVWDQFSPYHVDRCEHVAHALRERVEVFGLEIASRSNLYAWPEARATEFYTHITLFPGRKFEETKWWERLWMLVRSCLRYRIDMLFVAGYNRLDIFLISLLIRLVGRTVFVMAESKFDDKPRFWLKEILKVCMLATYNGCFVGGKRTAAYLYFLGFHKRSVAMGYDSISLDRVRLNSGWGGSGLTAFKDRYFLIIARFVEKKNLFAALDAYRNYAQLLGAEARPLHLAGSGPLEPKIRDYIRTHDLKNVVLHGFVNEVQLAQILKGALALMLPSKEEQWGLVVNEALALNLPALVSTNVGARDTLVRQGVNGFVIESLNVEGWVWCMTQLSQSEELWSRMAAASSRLAPLGDVAEFSKGCAKLLGYVDLEADPREHLKRSG
jgi:glycosyltransferase involved in cell wall biosynthesis